MALSTAIKSAMVGSFHGIGNAEELAAAIDNATTAIGSATAADLTKLHAITATAVELNTNAGVTPGTTAAGLSIVAGATKQVDTLAEAAAVVGTTTTPGSASQAITTINKKTAIVDNTATSIFTVTCPNGSHSALVKLELLSAVNNAGVLDSARIALGYAVFSRVTGAALVGSLATLTNGAIATSGTATLTLAYSLTAVAGAVGATNTMDIQVTLVKTGGTNHQIVALATIINSEATGMTIASD